MATMGTEWLQAWPFFMIQEAFGLLYHIHGRGRSQDYTLRFFNIEYVWGLWALC